MIRRINLFGAPGTGKSTVAAGLFYFLKLRQFNVELVREYIKNWVYKGIEVKSYDHIYIFGKQLHAEDLLLSSGVELIITDSPVTMSLFYADSLRDSQINICKDFDKKYQPLNILLKRGNIPYKTIGRYQTEEQAKTLDESIALFLNNNNVNYHIFPSENFDALLNFVIESLK